MDWDGFEQAADALKTTASILANAAGERSAALMAFADVGKSCKSCKSCHRDYRIAKE